MSATSFAALQAEVGELREEVDTLRLELSRLRRVVGDLRAQVAAEADQRSEDSYTVVSDSRSSAGPAPAAATGGSSVDSKPAITWAERERIAKEVGRFLARSLAGEHRGASGRDRNPLASRVWLVARDFEGQILSPVRVFKSWGGCKPLVKSKADCGDSVFIGFPTEKEARLACETAGLAFPEMVEK